MSPEQVWKEFCAKLKSSQFSQDDCRPLMGKALYEFLISPPAGEFKAFLAEQPVPSWTLAGDKLIFELSTGEDTSLRLDFLLAEDCWFLFHIESITIPVKDIPSLPFSDFPGLPKWENWMQEEISNSEKVNLLVPLAKEKGLEEALEWFREGTRYRINAISWVPYFPEHKAFVIYAPVHYQGYDVTLTLFEGMTD